MSNMQTIKKFPETIFIYDLPQRLFTSTALAKVIADKSNYELKHQPQVRRDPNKPFYTAVIKVENQDKFPDVVKALRYFEFEGKPCRALPYSNELLGSNVTRLAEQNVFIRKIPKNKNSEALEQYFSEFGEVISCKVSINEDYSSRGYGFVCFKDPEAATKALAEHEGKEINQAIKFAPKSKTEFRKVFNNIFVKNIPDEWTEANVKEAFGVFGQITSIFFQKHENGLFAFICYGTDQQADREYGPSCAAKAVQEMDGKQIGDKVLYVKAALKKSEREKELQHETLKYKNSKKRCNLFVKNFAPETTEDDLRNLFAQYGEIESLKLFGKVENKSPYAFVCFKTPDAASQAKSASLQLGNRQLYINHYEMKQQRDLINESNKDKQDWQRYQSEHFTTGLDQYNNYEQISSLLRLLMHSMQNKPQGGFGAPPPQMNQRSHSAGGQTQPQGGYPNQHQGGNQQRYHSQNNQGQQYPRQNNNHFNNRGGHNQNVPPPMQGGHSNMMPPTIMPMPMPTPMGMPMPQGRPMPDAQGVQFAPSNDPTASQLYQKTLPIYAAIVPINPSYKNTVGTTIFEFVTKIVGPNFAPKITGMLIDLPIQDIQKYCTDYDLFVHRVNQAQQLLTSQAQPQ